VHFGCSFCGCRLDVPGLNHKTIMTQVTRLLNSTNRVTEIYTVLPTPPTKVLGQTTFCHIPASTSGSPSRTPERPEAETEFLLSTQDRGDRRPHDILRGSHAGNLPTPVAALEDSGSADDRRPGARPAPKSRRAASTPSW
jgi:hypothetical protein